MTFFDIVLIVVALVTLVVGWTRGFLVGLGALLGFALGVWLGRLSTPWLQDLVSQGGGLEAANLVIAVPLLAGFILSSIVAYLCYLIRVRMGDGAIKGFDSVLGAGTSVIALALVVWIFAGFIRTTPFVAPNRWVAESQIVAGLDRIMPTPSTEALGQVAQALAANGFPQVFSGQREVIRGVGEPSQAMEAVGRGASESTVKILSTSEQCQATSEGSGWVLEDDLIVTNAHVVAGSSSLTVQVGGVGEPYSAEVIAFDPDRDVAVLDASDLDAPALDIGDPLLVGDDSVVVGYPGNGPYTISPSRVRDRMDARGLDIYNEDTIVREIYSLRGVVREGNSGGPLLNAEGDAVGLVFARSASDPETGYALTMDEIQPVLDAAQAGREPVGTGACAATSQEE